MQPEASPVPRRTTPAPRSFPAPRGRPALHRRSRRSPLLPRCAKLRENLGHPPLHLGERSRRIDDADALRLARGKRPIRRADTLEEGDYLILEAIGGARDYPPGAVARGPCLDL